MIQNTSKRCQYIIMWTYHKRLCIYMHVHNQLFFDSAVLYSYRSGLSDDPCLRNALAQLYSTLYGRLTPPCISQVHHCMHIYLWCEFQRLVSVSPLCVFTHIPQKFCVTKVGIVIDLKERKAQTSLASPVGTPSNL